LTLVELIIVVAILAVLAMIIIPKLDGVQSNANHAVGATSANDTARYMQTFRTMYNRYPDGYDSLTDGTNLWPQWTPTTRGLHSTFFGSTGKFAQGTLSATDVTGLNAVGIFTLYNVNTAAAASVRPSDMFTAAGSLAAGNPVAIVNTGSSGGKKIIDHVYRDNLKPGGVSGTLPFVSGSTTERVKLIALGFGPLNQLVGKMMLECPMYPNVDHQLVYARNLVIFEVGNSRAVFKTVVATDGDLIDDMTTYMSRPMQ